MDAFALERYVCESFDPEERDPLSAPFGQIEIDLTADTPLRIETTPEGGLHVTYYRLIGGELVATLLRFTPGAAANLMGGLYRALQAGEPRTGGELPPVN